MSRQERSDSGFAESGFVVLRGAIDRPEVRRVRRLVDAVLVENRPVSCDRPNNLLVPLRWNDRAVDDLLAVSSLIEQIRAATSAADLRWIAAYVSVRAPRTDALAWHQDWWCWHHPATFGRAPIQVAALCYLEDVDAANAAPCVLPGSHHRSTALHSRIAMPGADGSAALQATDDDAITIPVSAGDVVLVDYRVLHATTPNRTARSRECLLMSFAPDWSDLPREIQSHLASHAALPRSDEAMPPAYRHHRLLPTFDGERHDLTLSRHPPSHFDMN
jgi:ectoine hydroxylase-related dioxygenase (phytanoyl-CoA dioxygenase family)